MRSTQAGNTRRAGPFRPWLAAVAAIAALTALPAAAQYKVVGSDGRVSYSDVPPAAGTSVRGVRRLQLEDVDEGAAGGGGALGQDESAWPAALSAIARRYPVVLYTTTQCAACDAGRAWLLERGIPFAQRNVTTPADAAELARIAPGRSTGFPLLRIGTQLVTGYTLDEWSNYADAAGYPATSQLPARYRPAPSQPLAAVSTRAPPPVSRIDAAAAAASNNGPGSPTVLMPVPGGISF